MGRAVRDPTEKPPPPAVLRAMELMRQMRSSEVVRQLEAQFGCKRSMAYIHVREARRLRMMEFERVPLKEHAAHQVARLERIVDLAEAAGKYRDAVAAIAQMIRITGTAAPDEVKHTHSGVIATVHALRMKNLTEEELRLLASIDAPLIEDTTPSAAVEGSASEH